MHQNSVEACVNVWCIMDQRSGLVYRVAARGYALQGSDKEKGAVLKSLAATDFHLAEELQVLSRFQTTIIEPTGKQVKLRGLFPDSFHANFANILDVICKELETRSPKRFVADQANPRWSKLTFSAEAYYVLTFLMEDDNGQLSLARA